MLPDINCRRTHIRWSLPLFKFRPFNYRKSITIQNPKKIVRLDKSLKPWKNLSCNLLHFAHCTLLLRNILSKISRYLLSRKGTSPCEGSWQTETAQSKWPGWTNVAKATGSGIHHWRHHHFLTSPLPWQLGQPTVPPRLHTFASPVETFLISMNNCQKWQSWVRHNHIICG